MSSESRVTAVLGTCGCFLPGHLPVLQWASSFSSKIFPLSAAKLLVFKASFPIFLYVLLFPFQLLLLFFFSIPLNPKPFSIPWHNPALVFSRRLSVLYPQGSVVKEEAPRPSCSQLGREGGTQMLRGTQKQGCAQNKKKLQLSSGCSVRSERQLESWHCRSCSPRPSPPPGITLLCLALIFHQRSSGRIQIRLSIVSELGDRREI